MTRMCLCWLNISYHHWNMIHSFSNNHGSGTWQFWKTKCIFQDPAFHWTIIMGGRAGQPQNEKVSVCSLHMSVRPNSSPICQLDLTNKILIWNKLHPQIWCIKQDNLTKSKEIGFFGELLLCRRLVWRTFPSQMLRSWKWRWVQITPLIRIDNYPNYPCMFGHF